MLDDFNCPAINHKRRGRRRFLSPKIHNHFFRFIYIKFKIVIVALTDKFVYLIPIFRFSSVVSSANVSILVRTLQDKQSCVKREYNIGDRTQP